MSRSILHANSQRCRKALQYFYPKPPEREREAARVLFEFSSFIGLGQQVVLKALSTFGWEGLFIVVDYLAERTERLKHPEGYLSTMIRCFERGEPVAGGSVQPLPLPRNHCAV
jgi:replication initiation protein RepC